MNDVNAFERLVADVADELMGPSRSFDARAIVQSAKTTAPQRRWIDVVQRTVGRRAAPMEVGSSVFSVLKFVTAAVIVALFGGFLLAGILATPQSDELAPAAVTASPSPMTTDMLLPGVTLTVEEIEPGILHILNDGVRDLAHLDTADCAEAVMVDGAGAVWRFVHGERYFRLGAEEEWPQGPEGTCLGVGTNFVIADGRLVTGFDDLTDLLGPQSASPEELGLDPDGHFGGSPLAAQADGTLWLHGGDNWSVLRVPPGGVAEALSWKDVYQGGAGELIAVTPDGDAWLTGSSAAWISYPEGVNPIEVLLHFDGEAWETVPVPDDVASASGGAWDVGPDGTVWMEGDAAPPHRSLIRYDGSDWTIFGEGDGVRPWGEQLSWGWSWPPTLRVAPDGSVWVLGSGPGELRCGGLGRFDGESWASYLPNLCIASYDIARDGAVWVVAAEFPELYTETYVITPEAVAGTG